MKTWDYANLSKLAKANGGPEELVDKLINSGKLQMLPWIGVAFGCGIVATKLVQHFKKLKDKSAAELEAAKQEVIQGIKDYDAAQVEETENNLDHAEGGNENG